MRIKRIIPSLLFVMIFSTARSQSVPKIKDSLDILLSGNLSNVNGNSQRIIASNLTYDARTDKMDFLYSLSYININKNGSVISDDISFKILPRFTYKNLFFFNYEEVSRLYSRRIDIRLKAGGGGGAYIINSPAFKWNLSYGIIYSNSIYVDGSRMEVFRNSPRTQIFGNFKKLTIFAEGLYQPAFEDPKNFNYNWAIKIGTPISKRFMISLNSIRTFESYNFGGTSSINDMFTIGIEYKY